jgi:hypothetical protein
MAAPNSRGNGRCMAPRGRCGLGRFRLTGASASPGRVVTPASHHGRVPVHSAPERHDLLAHRRDRVHRNPDTQISRAVESTAGFTFLLSSPKAANERGITLRVTMDAHPPNLQMPSHRPCQQTRYGTRYPEQPSPCGSQGCAGRNRQLLRSREKLSPQQLALHGLGGPVCDLARSQPHPAVDTLPQQVGVADVAGVLLDHVDQHLPQ